MIEGLPLVELGPVGLVSLFVVALLLGRLVPRRTLEDVIRDRDDWRAAHKVSEEARIIQGGQVTELLEHARTTSAALRALPPPGRDPQ